MYSITSTERLRALCVKKNWFTEGSNTQYEKLFRANSLCAPIEEIATIIWICSDEEIHCRRDIIEALKEAREEYQNLIAGEAKAEEFAKQQAKSTEAYMKYTNCTAKKGETFTVQIMDFDYDLIDNNPRVEKAFPSLYAEVKKHKEASDSTWYELSEQAYSEYQKYFVLA